MNRWHKNGKLRQHFSIIHHNHDTSKISGLLSELGLLSCLYWNQCLSKDIFNPLNALMPLDSE